MSLVPFTGLSGAATNNYTAPYSLPTPSANYYGLTTPVGYSRDGLQYRFGMFGQTHETAQKTPFNWNMPRRAETQRATYPTQYFSPQEYDVRRTLQNQYSLSPAIANNLSSNFLYGGYSGLGRTVATPYGGFPSSYGGNFGGGYGGNYFF